MSFIKTERLAMRDEFERTYGIKLRDDDELLPIIHFISKSSNSIKDSQSESKKLLEELKMESKQIFADSANQTTRSLEQTQRITVESVKLSKALFDHYGIELKKLKSEIDIVHKSIQSMPEIPSEIKINTVKSFETMTMSFLWKYLLFSVPLVILSLLFATIFYNHNRELTEKYRPNQVEWLYRFYEHARSNSPQAVDNYINRNPIPKN